MPIKSRYHGAFSDGRKSAQFKQQTIIIVCNSLLGWLTNIQS